MYNHTRIQLHSSTVCIIKPNLEDKSQKHGKKFIIAVIATIVLVTEAAGVVFTRKIKMKIFSIKEGKK